MYNNQTNYQQPAQMQHPQQYQQPAMQQHPMNMQQHPQQQVYQHPIQQQQPTDNRPLNYNQAVVPQAFYTAAYNKLGGASANTIVKVINDFAAMRCDNPNVGNALNAWLNRVLNSQYLMDLLNGVVAISNHPALYNKPEVMGMTLIKSLTLGQQGAGIHQNIAQQCVGNPNAVSDIANWWCNQIGGWGPLPIVAPINEQQLQQHQQRSQQQLNAAMASLDNGLQSHASPQFGATQSYEQQLLKSNELIKALGFGSSSSSNNNPVQQQVQQPVPPQANPMIQHQQMPQHVVAEQNQPVNTVNTTESLNINEPETVVRTNVRYDDPISRKDITTVLKDTSHLNNKPDFEGRGQDYEDDELTFRFWRWCGSFGRYTNKSVINPTTKEDFLKIIKAREARVWELIEKFEGDRFVKGQANYGSPEHLKAFNIASNEFTPAANRALLGTMIDGDNIIGVNTVPFGAADGFSVRDMMDKLFPGDLWDQIEDAVHPIVLFGREYLIIDSTNEIAHKRVQFLREEADHFALCHRDNTSAKGHYYLINPQPQLAAIQQPYVIDDFYDVEEHMINPNRYCFTPASVGFKDDLEDPNADAEILGASDPALKMNNHALTFRNVEPIAAANSIRDYYHVNRYHEWDNKVLSGSKIENNEFILTPTQKDRTFWKKLQDALKDGTITDTVTLGDFLAAEREEGNITERLIRTVESRLSKEYNSLLNDTLNDKLIIENSFIDEYMDLIDIINSPETPALVRSVFHDNERFMLECLRTEEKLTEEAIDEFSRQSCYNVIEGNVILTANNQQPVTKVVHHVKRTSSIVVLPITAEGLGVNPYSKDSVISWNSIPDELYTALKETIEKGKHLDRVILVTSDDYVLTVNGCKSELACGSITPLR